MAAGDIGASWFETPCGLLTMRGEVLQIQHDGQISSVCRNRVKPQHQKYSALQKHQIRCITRAVPHPQEGRFAVVTKRWARDAMDAVASGMFNQAGRKRPQRTAKSCGPGAATLASSRWSDPSVTVAKEAAHRGEHERSRKTIARGKSGRSG